MDKVNLVACVTAVMVVTLSLPTVMASDNTLLAERLQRHHEAPPARPGQEHGSPPPRDQGRAPEHAGEQGRPEHSTSPGRPEHSRQDRSRESRGERPQHSGGREPTPATGEDSRWSTHGAPESDTAEDADDASDDDRIYFQRYP